MTEKDKTKEPYWDKQANGQVVYTKGRTFDDELFMDVPETELPGDNKL